MGDLRQVGKPFQYRTSHLGQFSLAIMGRCNEYQQKLGHKTVHHAMH